MRRIGKEQMSLGLVLFNLFIVFVGIGLVVPVMPSFAKELHLSGETVGYLISAFAFAQLLVSPITGVWVDTIGRKKMIVLGLFFFLSRSFYSDWGIRCGFCFCPESWEASAARSLCRL